MISNQEIEDSLILQDKRIRTLNENVSILNDRLNDLLGTLAEFIGILAQARDEIGDLESRLARLEDSRDITLH